MEDRKWSVGVIVTNPSKSLFYLQQKDETYFVKKHRLKYCFFGGGIKEGEKEIQALGRELKEELGIYFANEIMKKIRRLFDTYFINIANEPYKHTLYESVLDDEKLEELSKIIPNEGKRGLVVTREELLNLPFFSDLKKARSLYLKTVL